MAHGYRNLQQWNQWLHESSLAASVLATEKAMLSHLMASHYGKHALLLGVPNQFNLLEASKVPCHSLVSPFLVHDRQPGYIEGDFHQVPILSGSIDLVVLPHTFEYVDSPRNLINEACRIVKPEGLIALIGFNPYSSWGLRKLLSRASVAPWSSRYIDAQKIKSWLRLAEFHIEEHKSAMVRPPITNHQIFEKFEFLERLGKVLPFLGSIYFVLARAKVIPLTPIRMKWKQQLGAIRISTSISGNIARQSHE